MRVKDLQTLFDYGYWADRKLFDVVVQLTPEEFSRPVAGSYGSIRNTLVHMLSAEWGWLDRCGGPRRGPALAPEDYPTASVLIGRWEQVERMVRAFLADLRDEELDRVVEFALGAGPKQAMPLGHLMQHAAVHGIHHRGQLALLLRLLGRTPGNFDLLFYQPGAGAGANHAGT